MIRLFSLDRRGINPARFDGGNSWLGTHVLGQTICNGLCRTGSKWSGIFLDLIRKFDFLNWSLPNDKGVHIEHRHAFYTHKHTHSHRLSISNSPTWFDQLYNLPTLSHWRVDLFATSDVRKRYRKRVRGYDNLSEKAHRDNWYSSRLIPHTHACITFVVEISGNFWSCFTKICSDIFH